MSTYNQKHHKKKRSFNQFNSKQNTNTNYNYNNKNRPSSPNKKRRYNYNSNSNTNSSNKSYSSTKNIRYGPDSNNNSNNKHTSKTNDDSLESILSNIKCNKPRKWTVSIAIAGSVMNTAKTPQLQTYLAGQFARIISIFSIDEIIIFSETGSIIEEQPFKPDPNLFLFRLLQYLETPQYLRRLLFPVHNDFRYIGMCRPLRTPHHLNKNELSPYREGIVLKQTVINPKQSKDNKSKKHKNKNKKLPKVIANMQANDINDENKVSLVSIGFNKLCVIDKKLNENMRVTVKIKDWKNANYDEQYWYGKAIKPTYPMQKDGIYWGYETRFAHDIGEVLSESIYKDGYDVVIGTSDKGCNVYDDGFKIEKFKHLLIVFGGPKGLESCTLNKGENGEKMKLDKPELLFDQYINVCPYQGTRTIRSEEAVLMTLSVLQPHLQNNYD